VNAPDETLASPEDPVLRLRQQVTDPLKARFIERDEVIDLIALALVAGEHLFLYGPPGTAKSALIREFARSVHGRYFEYMLTRFSEPNEIFGPIDLVRLRDGVVATVTTHMLPEAEFAFLDELFNANSAILNNLLTVLNERVYRRGAEVHRLPLLSLFSASNHLPEDDALLALFDRFLLRCQVDHLPRASTSRLLTAGWELEIHPSGLQIADCRLQNANPGPHFDMPELRLLAAQTAGVDLTTIRDTYTEVVHRIRDLGIAFSDRRAVKAQKLIAASAVLCKREAATPADLWVLRYVWDRAEQIAPLRGLIQGILEQHPQPLEESGRPHPQASPPEKADPEELARQLDAIQKELDGATGGKAGAQLSLVAAARLREQVARLADRAAWVRDDPARQHLLQRTGQLLQQLG
jgi:MoxR-like ATPase